MFCVSLPILACPLMGVHYTSSWINGVFFEATGSVLFPIVVTKNTRNLVRNSNKTKLESTSSWINGIFLCNNCLCIVSYSCDEKCEKSREKFSQDETWRYFSQKKSRGREWKIGGETSFLSCIFLWAPKTKTISVLWATPGSAKNTKKILHLNMYILAIFHTYGGVKLNILKNIYS